MVGSLLAKVIKFSFTRYNCIPLKSVTSFLTVIAVHMDSFQRGILSNNLITNYMALSKSINTILPKVLSLETII